MTLIARLTFIFMFVFAVTSCTHKLQFNASLPKSNTFQSIKTLAIGEVELVNNREWVLRDNVGKWSVSDRALDLKGIEALVKRSLVSNLNAFSDYEVVDLETFKLLYSDSFSSVRPSSGVAFKQIDAVLNLRFSIHVINQEGTFDEVKTFNKRTTRKVGKEWKTTQNSSSQRVVRTPYQLKNATITMTGEVIKVANGAIESLGTFSDTFLISLGSGTSPPNFSQEPKGAVMSFLTRDKRSKDGKIEDLPFYQLKHEVLHDKPGASINLAKRIGVQMSNMILPKFSGYMALASRTIDVGGDQQAVKLMKKGKVEDAKRRIEGILSSKTGKTPANLYNLGICNEAVGESQIAAQYYEEALGLDEGNLTYIEALGALENPTL